MASPNFTSILKISVIIFIVLFPNNVAHGQPISTTHISVTPLWDQDVDNESCQFEERNVSQGIGFLHGSAQHICTIQINASSEYYTLLEIPNTDLSNETFSLHIERKGDLDVCTNRFVVFPDMCHSILLQDSLYLSLQGDVSVLITGISTSETNPVCPELSTNVLPTSMVNLTPYCENAKGYTNGIRCYFSRWSDDKCEMIFPYNCNATLGHREVIYHCYNDDDNDLPQSNSLIIYQNYMPHLDLTNNNIIKFEGRPFQGLSMLRNLDMSYNELTMLQGGLFKDLAKLKKLSIVSNKLETIDERAFEGLRELYNLMLYSNNLKSLPERLFHNLEKLYNLYLKDNLLETLNPKQFNHLKNLTSLNIGSNRLVTLPSGVFKQLTNLKYLNLGGNQLVAMPDSIDDLSNLKDLVLSNNQLVTLRDAGFIGLSILMNLYLNDNQLATLATDTFIGLDSLYTLTLSYNHLSTLPSNVFYGLDNLEKLHLSDNQLAALPNDIFTGLGNVYELQIHNNQLKTMPNDILHELISLKYLFLGNLQLEILPVFNNLTNLMSLSLNINQLATLHNSTFRGLSNLDTLDVSKNQLVTLPKGVFNDLINLLSLQLSDNLLVRLNKDMLKDTIRLYYLNVHNNRITYIDKDIFNDTTNIIFIDLSANFLTQAPSIKGLFRLSFLDVRENPLTAITHDTFSTMTNFQLYASQHEICDCYKPFDIYCIATDQRSPYITCDRLLSDRTLVVFMWIIGINALGGNLFVLVWRKTRTKLYKVQDLLLSNLAMSDSLMGFYMIIVAGADIYYGEYFPMLSETWRSGITCRIAGAISIASTQLSIFFLTLISIDRYVGIKYPYSDNKLGKRSTLTIAVVIWICSLTLGVVPSILSGWNFKFYDNSHVCIGLPLALTKTYTQTPIYGPTIGAQIYKTEFAGLVNGLYFSTALFLGLNGLCYLIILGCYIEIFRTVAKSAKQSGRTRDTEEQMKLTRKVLAIVATDFVCVFPLIVLGILVQTRVTELPPSVFAWLVTFVLPINSAINPYLYTIAEMFSNKRGKANKSISRNTTMTEANTRNE